MNKRSKVFSRSFRKHTVQDNKNKPDSLQDNKNKPDQSIFGHICCDATPTTHRLESILSSLSAAQLARYAVRRSQIDKTLKAIAFGYQRQNKGDFKYSAVSVTCFKTLVSPSLVFDFFDWDSALNLHHFQGQIHHFKRLQSDPSFKYLACQLRHSNSLSKWRFEKKLSTTLKAASNIQYAEILGFLRIENFDFFRCNDFFHLAKIER